MFEHRGPTWRHAPAALGTALLVAGAVVGTQVALADAGAPRAPLSPYGEGGFTVGAAAVDKRITITSADDGSYVLGYTPAGGDVVLDLDLLSGDRAQPWWYDVAGGRTLRMAPLASAGVARFPVPKEGGGPAWVLVVDDVAAGYGSPDADVVAQATGRDEPGASASGASGGQDGATASGAGASPDSSGSTTTSDPSTSDPSGSPGGGSSGSESGSGSDAAPGGGPASGASPEAGRFGTTGSGGGSGVGASGEAGSKDDGDPGDGASGDGAQGDGAQGDGAQGDGASDGDGPGHDGGSADAGAGHAGSDGDSDGSGSSEDGKRSGATPRPEQPDGEPGKPQSDEPEADPPKSDEPEAGSPKEETPKAGSPKSEQPEAEQPEQKQPKERPEQRQPKAGQPGEKPKASAEPAWDKLAGCESSGNWGVNSGNGYYGGLQFDRGTWSDFGGTKYAPRADQATKEQQIEIATKVRDARGGYSSWPACSSKLGLPK